MGRIALVSFVSCVLAACGSSAVDPDAGPGSDAAATDGGTSTWTLGPASRPAPLYVPPAHDGTTPLPLVLLLHGHGASGMLENIYLRLTRVARDEGFYVLYPDGTTEADGERFWDMTGAIVDDEAYLRGLLDEAESLVPVAPGEVYVIGHSNGGFMAYVLACSSSDRIDAIVSLAGSELVDATCTPARPVSVLEVHGTADDVVRWEGGTVLGWSYASTPTTIERWVTRSGCDPAGAEALDPIDLVSSIDGPETVPTAYRTGCAGAEVELWTMEGGGHIPALTTDATPAMIAWLRAHRRATR